MKVAEVDGVRMMVSLNGHDFVDPIYGDYKLWVVDRKEALQAISED